MNRGIKVFEYEKEISIYEISYILIKLHKVYRIK